MNILIFFNNRFMLEQQDLRSDVNIVTYKTIGGERKKFNLCIIKRPLLVDGNVALKRILNQETRERAILPYCSRAALRWDDQSFSNLELVNNNNEVIAIIPREPFLQLGFDNSRTIEIQGEFANVILNIVKTGSLPDEYYRENLRRPAEDAERESELTAKIKKEPKNVIDDIPEDVFNNESIVEKIKKCGEVYGNTKKLPVIIRFEDKKLMITDTAMTEDFLYLDVVEIPKKEIKLSFKFKDYISYFDPEIVNAINTSSDTWEAIRTSNTINVADIPHDPQQNATTGGVTFDGGLFDQF